MIYYRIGDELLMIVEEKHDLREKFALRKVKMVVKNQFQFGNIFNAIRGLIIISTYLYYYFLIT